MMTSRPEKPLNVLFVSHSFPPPGKPLANIGGMQRVATELYEALDENPAIRVTPLVLKTSWRWTHIRIFPFLAILIWRIPRLVVQEKIDVVLFSSMVTAAIAPLIRRNLQSRGVCLAAIAHGLDVTDPTVVWQRLVPRTLRSLDRVLPVSRATAEECRNRGMLPENIAVVPNGVDVSRVPKLTDRVAARRELLAGLNAAGAGIPHNALILCSVGRHVERKGFQWFANEVMPTLPDGVIWLLVGEGPETHTIREAVGANGLQSRVRLLGRVPEEHLWNLYLGSDLFIMPNIPVPGDMEGFGVVMLEAGLCGLPVLTSDLEGIRDVISEGSNGRLLPSGDASAFASAIMQYWRDRAKQGGESEDAAVYIRSTFPWSRIAERYGHTLQKLHESSVVA